MDNNVFKWIGLGAPYGLEVEKKIKDNWSEWEDIITKLHLNKTKKYHKMSSSEIAKYIYINTLWGFCFDKWDTKPKNAIIFFRTSVYQRVQTFEGYPREVYLLRGWIEKLLS